MEKIKQFFAKLVQNKKLLWITIGVAAVLVAAIVLAVIFLGGNSETPAGSDVIDGCTVEVKTEGGMALEGIGVYERVCV